MSELQEGLPQPNQPSLKEEVPPTPEQALFANIEKSKKAVDALVVYAKQHGADSTNFSHLTDLWDPKMFSIDTKNVLKTHRGYTLPATGEVLIASHEANRFHTILHESIHRAAILKNLQLKENLDKGQPNPADLDFFRVHNCFYENGQFHWDPSAMLDFTSVEEKQNFLQYWVERTKYNWQILNEGFTEWTTQKGYALMQELNPNQEFQRNKNDFIYPVEIEKMNLISAKIRERTSKSSEEVESMFITAALTHDWRDVMSSTGGLELLEILLQPPSQELTDRYPDETLQNSEEPASEGISNFPLEAISE